MQKAKLTNQEQMDLSLGLTIHAGRCIRLDSERPATNSAAHHDRLARHAQKLARRAARTQKVRSTCDAATEQQK